MNERDIFLAALDIEDDDARTAFLREQCGDDAELLTRVEALLSSHEGRSRFLNTPAVAQLAEGSEAHDAPTVQICEGSTEDQESVAATRPDETMIEDQFAQDDEIPLGYLEPSSKADSLGRLGHYDVLEVVGRGAFGIVLRAFDEKLHRVVAIKVLSPEMASTSPARKRFLREARTSAQIRHENVVAIYDVENDPIPYLVMEYIPGKTLQRRLDDEGPLNLPDVLRLGKQIADGLSAAHAEGLIHRDIKPGNILLEGGVTERVKITDFGLARTADDASMTQSGMIAGTPLYMAPEQALGQKLDQRADLFSLGSVLYQMLSGRPPFRAASAVAVLKRVAEDTPRPIQEIIPEVPDWMCDLIGHLHAKNPDKRYGTAQEVSELLEQCAADVREGRTPQITPPAVSPMSDENATAELRRISSVREASSRPARRTWVKAAAAVLVLLVGLGITEATGVTRLASTVIRLATGSGTPAVENGGAVENIPIEATAAATPPENYALAFDGNSYVATPVMVPSAGAFTIEAWARPFGWEDSKLFSVICNAQRAGVSLELRAFETVNWGFSIQDQQGYQKALSNRPPETDRAVHLAGVFDGRHARLFVNGNRMEAEPALELPLKPSSLPLMIGANPQPDDENPIYYFNGLIDEVRISNVARYTEDFTPALRFEPDQQTLALYHFDEGAGDVLNDASGHGHDGKIVGAKWLRVDADLNTSEASSEGWYGWYAAPPPAIAPFDAAQAKAHQEAWAKYLGVPVEYENSIGMKFRLIPPGEYMMGTSHADAEKILSKNLPGWCVNQIKSETPRRRVVISKPFYLGTTEVTLGQFKKFISATNYKTHAEANGAGGKAWTGKRIETKPEFTWRHPDLASSDSHPVGQLCPRDAEAFCDWLRALEGREYELPEEEQWEYACRAGTETWWSCGEDSATLEDHGLSGWDLNFNGVKVAQRPANPFGLFDVHGNFLEICRSSKDGYVVRGGQSGNHIYMVRSASRNRSDELDSYETKSFRVALRVGVSKTTTAKPHQWRADAPAPAIAPFDAKQAKAHQEAWAKYLGVRVEYTNSIGMKFRLIPPGEFDMGSTPEEIEAVLKVAGNNENWREVGQSEAPQHRVSLTQPMYLGVTEVTQAQYKQVMETNPSYFSPVGEMKDRVAGVDTSNHPVERVTWNDAVEFCAKLSRQEDLKPFEFRTGETVSASEGTGYRLPTEAEWEYACRAGTTTRFWSGDEENDLNEAGWFGRNTGGPTEGRTYAVGELKANPFGLSDVHGNVWEWVQDNWDPAFYARIKEDVAANPSNPSSADSRRVVRGGYWETYPSRCRSSARAAFIPSTRHYGIGFRAALTVGAVKKGLGERPAAPKTSQATGWPTDAPAPAIAAFDVQDKLRSATK